MAKHKIKDPKAVICLFLFLIFFASVITLFIMGGIFYSDEHPKVLNYANSMCVVDSRSWKMYQCKARYYFYNCYGPKWDVRHGENRTIFAIVEGEKRYRSYSDALDKANEYQVSKYHNYLIIFQKHH